MTSTARSRSTRLAWESSLGQAKSYLDHVWEHFDVVPLDQVVRGKVVVLKIDVEGMEDQVLKGAQGILRKYHPVVFAKVGVSRRTYPRSRLR